MAWPCYYNRLATELTSYISYCLIMFHQNVQKNNKYILHYIIIHDIKYLYFIAVFPFDTGFLRHWDDREERH